MKLLRQEDKLRESHPHAYKTSWPWMEWTEEVYRQQEEKAYLRFIEPSRMKESHSICSLKKVLGSKIESSLGTPWEVERER